jgi:NAD(P)-dependent dehydrogenase (short-subunit alcohol dehydrogenase family)
LDLSDLSSIKAFAQQIDEIDILINNAGVAKKNKELTKDGLECTSGTNWGCGWVLMWVWVSVGGWVWVWVGLGGCGCG